MAGRYVDTSEHNWKFAIGRGLNGDILIAMTLVEVRAGQFVLFQGMGFAHRRVSHAR